MSTEPIRRPTITPCPNDLLRVDPWLDDPEFEFRVEDGWIVVSLTDEDYDD